MYVKTYKPGDRVVLLSASYAGYRHFVADKTVLTVQDEFDDGSILLTGPDFPNNAAKVADVRDVRFAEPFEGDTDQQIADEYRASVLHTRALRVELEKRGFDLYINGQCQTKLSYTTPVWKFKRVVKVDPVITEV